MNCNECTKRIKAFLNDSLNSKTCIEFVDHVRGCRECMEELSIEFLVNEGLKRLDTATSFNLDRELHDKLDQAYAKARFNRRFAVIISVAIFGVAFCLGLLLSSLFNY